MDYVLEYERCIRCFEEGVAVRERRRVSLDLPLTILSLGIMLTLIGMFLMMASIILTPWPLNATTGGIVVIGPIPFIFGVGEGLEVILPILALIIIALIILQMILFRRKY